MMNIPLDALDSYKKLIDEIEQPKSTIDISKVLEILSARDALQVELEQQKPVPIDRLQKVIELDAHLRANAFRITTEIDKQKGKEFAHWRKSIQPSTKAWWWQLETIHSPPPKKKLEWLFRGLWIAGWATNLSLLISIASRLGGAGSVGFFDPMVVIVPGIGALISASNKLPKFEKLLKDLHIPEPSRELTKFLATMMVSGVLVGGGYTIIPLMSKFANSNGAEKYEAGDLIEAEKDYKRAISLDGTNIEAHYNLGNLYESWHDIDKAKKQYEIAIAGKLPSAYNNLGRLYIQEKKYSLAAALLNNGLLKLSDRERKDSQFLLSKALISQSDGETSNQGIKYSLFKNLGWTMLKEGRYEDAKMKLQVAISIAGEEKPKDINYPAAAHCLMAQTLEKLKQPTASLKEWDKCSQWGSILNADEDTWLYLANQKKLSNKKNTSNKK
jgi:tetratricopeptide (TPR) repeat protein